MNSILTKARVYCIRSCCRRWMSDSSRADKTQNESQPKRKTTKSEIHRGSVFIDVKRMRLYGGDGGDGGRSFLSMPRKEYAGPDGGDGGNGGHVVFKANKNVRSLAKLQSIIKANKGVKGMSDTCHGKNAEHTVLDVPLGTRFRNEDGELLADLTTHDQLFVGARGGAGGKGNAFFLTNENRAPMEYETGGKGEESFIWAELRIMADAGLVGFPNVGKSSLLRAISRAKPKIAAYPFTTLHPHVGMIHYPDCEQIAVADLPGLVVNAHLNYGLGFSFLRHVERCRWLLYVLDASLPEPWTQLDALKYELEQFEPGLSSRPHAVVANKLDLAGAQDNVDRLQDRLSMPVFGLSAIKGINIRPLLQHLKDLHENHERGLT